MKDFAKKGKKTMELTGGVMCFACGKDNPIGLKLEFTWEKEAYTTYFTPLPEHQGYDGIVHGGILSTILDEVMGRMFFVQGEQVVTAELQVRFRQMVKVGQELFFRAEMIKDRGRIIEVQATACFKDGQVAADAQGKFMRIRKGKND